LTYLIETTDGEIFEVTNLFDAMGNETDCVAEAEVCVIKFDSDAWQSTEINGRAIHRLQ